MNTLMHTHIHTHTNTHSCECGRTHVSIHAHAHVHALANALANVEVDTSPIAARTRHKIARKNWESSIADADIDDLLQFLRNSTDPWERSLIPEVEKDAIQRFAARNKRAKV
jgi:non-ribosomal peptide synthetase component F